MAITALEKIAAIQAEADQKIAALKQEAVTELVKKIAETKSVLADLETEYEALTGKTLKGEKSSSGEGKRVRLSTQEKEALKTSILDAIKAHEGSAKIGLLVEKTGHTTSHVRKAVLELVASKAISQKDTRAKAHYVVTKK